MAINSISPILNESVSNVTSTNSVELGTRVTVSGIDYIYVYNVGAQTIAQGHMGFIAAATYASSIAGFYVAGSNAASHTRCHAVVGVAHNAAIATTKYGWLATRGVVYGAPDATEVSQASGVNLTTGVDGGFTVYDGATSATGVPLAYTVNSFITTVGTSKIAFRSPLFG